MKIKTLSCYFLIVLFFGCNSNNHNEYYHSKSLLNHQLVVIDSLFFHNSDTLFISQTGDIEVWHDFILISDFNFMKVWIFDKKLNLIRTLGGKGRGPGEYAYPPIILGTDQYLYLINTKFRNINIYDDNLNFVKEVKLPDKIVFQPYEPVYCNGNFIFFGFEPKGFSYENLPNMPSLFGFDKNFNLTKEFFHWGEEYKNKTAYLLNNLKVLLANDGSKGFFAKQTGLLRISHFNKSFKLIKNFGTMPQYYRKPPDVKFEDTQKSVDAATDFDSKTTKYLKLCYDTVNDNLLVNYVNLGSDFFYERTLLLGKHYLQIYNQDYDCIYDGPIPGKLAFAMGGKIYILTDEKPEFIKFKIFKLVKTGNSKGRK